MKNKDINRVEGQQLLCTISEILAGLLKYLSISELGDRDALLNNLLNIFWRCFENSGLDTITYFKDSIKWAVFASDPRRIKNSLLQSFYVKLSGMINALRNENFSIEITSSLAVDLQKLFYCIMPIFHEMGWKLALENNEINLDECSFVSFVASSCKHLINFPSEGVRNAVGSMVVSLIMCIPPPFLKSSEKYVFLPFIF